MSLKRRRRSYYIPLGCILPLVVFAGALIIFVLIPILAARTYGPPAENLNVLQRFQYSLSLLWYDGQVTRPVNSTAGEQVFIISQGEQAADVAEQLEQEGLVR